MNGTWLLARRNLARNRVRLLVSVGGVAPGLSPAPAPPATYPRGADQPPPPAYIERGGADVGGRQAGVRNLHMVASWLPDSVTEEVRAVDGVAEATPILYSTDTIAAGDERAVAYVIGLPPGAGMGGPWKVSEGAARPGRAEVIVDRGFARKAGVGLGDPGAVLGGEAGIVGLSGGAASLGN